MTFQEAKRDKYYRKTYGLTLRQWNLMLERQGGVCALCQSPMKKPNTDHDHKTGRVRGVLCYFCNRRFLGRGRESWQRHERAAAYLKSTFDGRKL